VNGAEIGRGRVLKQMDHKPLERATVVKFRRSSGDLRRARQPATSLSEVNHRSTKVISRPLSNDAALAATKCRTILSVAVMTDRIVRPTKMRAAEQQIGK
jgi:hypothetical protein